MDKAVLLSKLETVGQALAESTLIPVFSHFVFDGATVHAYNDIIGIVDDVAIDGSFALHGQTLLGVLRSLGPQEVTITPTSEEVEVKAKGSLLRLPFMPKASFVFSEPDEEWQGAVPAADMLEGFRLCLTTTSKDHSLPALIAVCMVIQNGTVKLYSCDGDSITKYLHSARVKTNGDHVFLLPPSFCEIAIKVFSGVKAGLYLSPGWAMMCADSGPLVYGRMLTVQTQFTHEALIADTLQTEKVKPTYVPVPQGLDKALDRAALITGKHSTSTLLTVKAEFIDVYTDSPMGEVHDRMRLPKHPDVVAKVNAAAMRRHIGICNEMAILENCTAYKRGDILLQVLANMGA